MSPRKVPQKINHHRKVVRVKTCGKSARIDVVMRLLGKPHLEQDKIGRLESPVLGDLRVCRLDRWLLRPVRERPYVQNPAYKLPKRARLMWFDTFFSEKHSP